MTWGNTDALGTIRKPPSSRLRLTSSSSRPPWPPRPRPFSTPGSVTRARSSSASRRSSLPLLSPRSRRSWRTPRSCSRSCSKALLILRVRCQFLLVTISIGAKWIANNYEQRLSPPRPNKRFLLESRLKRTTVSFVTTICAYKHTCAIAN